MLRISVLSQISIRVALATLLGLASLMAGAAERTTTYLHTDHLGSPILARSAAGTTVWQDDYGPWGESLQTPAGNAGDVGYTGHYTESGLGLTYAQARWYDQVAGVFLSVDPVQFGPVGQSGHFNRYIYVENNPYGFVDPDGRERWGVNGGFSVAFGALGLKVAVDANYDTESHEVGGSFKVGRRAGAKVAGKIGGYVEPSSEKGNVVDARVESNVEAAAELKLLVFSGQAEGKLFSHIGASSDDGVYADYGVEGAKSASWGPFSYDPDSKRTSLEFGGGLGVSGGVDFEVSGNGKLKD